jgi:hypothetical protein
LDPFSPVILKIRSRKSIIKPLLADFTHFAHEKSKRFFSLNRMSATREFVIAPLSPVSQRDAVSFINDFLLNENEKALRKAIEFKAARS